MLLRKCNNSFFKLLTHFKLSDVTFNASLEDVQPSCFFFGVYSWKKLLQSEHNKVKKILCLLNTDRSILKKWLELQAAHFSKKRKTKEDNLHVHQLFFIICFMIQYKKSQLFTKLLHLGESKRVLYSGFHTARCIPDSREWILVFVTGSWILNSNRYKDSGFLELYIPNSKAGRGLQIPRVKISRIPDSSSKNFPSSGIRIPLRGD